MSSLSLRTTLAHPAYRAGLRDMAGVSLGIAAWGLVTGVAMVKGGLPVWMALAMTFTVFAGSAQLAVVPLMVLGAPMWVVWATAFCVNLRFVIFSAQWRPYFMRFPLRLRLAFGYLAGDINYVLFMKRHAEPPAAGEAPEGQIEYFCGSVTANYLAWQLPSLIGIVLANAVPTHWGLGFAGTLALLGLTYALVSDRATLLAAVVAGAAAVAAFALPFKLYIVVAIAAAVCVGLLIDGGGDAGRRLKRELGRLGSTRCPA
jgi:predicted branched-subunit amino acid permease